MKMKRKYSLEDLQRVEGLLTENEKKLLYELAKKCDGNIVEIGSWKGLSTLCLAFGLKNGYKIYSIDPHEMGIEHKREKIKNSYKYFITNIKKFGVSKKVIPIVKTSKDAFENWNFGKIKLLWIDGNHNYEYVKYDVENWSKILEKNGILIMHDFGYSPTVYPDVRKVVFECLLNSMKFIKIEDNIIVFINNGKTGIFRKVIIKLKYEFHKFIINNRKSQYIIFLKKLLGRK